MPDGDRRVVVLRALGLGDFLTAVPALRGVRRRFPHAHIDLATSAWLTPLVELAGCVDEVVPTDELSGIDITVVPDVAVNLHGSGPQSIDVLRATGARELVTHAHPARPDVGGLSWIDDMHEVARWCRLVETLGTSVDPADLQLQRPNAVSAEPGAVVVHPGAASEARRWPPGRFARVAADLASEGHPVVVTGSRSERDIAEAVVAEAKLPASASLAGRLSLLELAALVAQASLVICGDTGVAHLASAFGIPSVVLFGPTPPARWGPPRTGPHSVLWHGTTGNPHAREPDPGLLRITTVQVLQAAHETLHQRSEVSP